MAVHGLGEGMLDLGDQMHGLTEAMEARLHQVEEQLAQVSDDAADGADGVFMVDALRAEMQRLEASVSELASSKPADEIATIARAVAADMSRAGLSETCR